MKDSTSPFKATCPRRTSAYNQLACRFNHQRLRVNLTDASSLQKSASISESRARGQQSNSPEGPGAGLARNPMGGRSPRHVFRGSDSSPDCVAHALALVVLGQHLSLCFGTDDRQAVASFFVEQQSSRKQMPHVVTDPLKTNIAG